MLLKMEIGVSAQLEELQYHLAKLASGNLPATAGAMGAGAKIIQDTWRNFAMGGPLPGITDRLKQPNGGYARSIRINRVGPFQYEIASEAQIAEWIENGTKELDMKTTHPFGPRSRVSKEGFPYLIVPFRWGTPKTIGFKNIMPESVYRIVKNKQKFQQTRTLMSTHNEPNYKGQEVQRREYVGADGTGGWGDRLEADMGEGVTANMVGMSSMVGQNRRAAGYMTFRVISAKQLVTRPYSWVKPAMPARPVTRAVADTTRDLIQEMVDDAMAEDIGV